MTADRVRSLGRSRFDALQSSLLPSNVRDDALVRQSKGHSDGTGRVRLVCKAVPGTADPFDTEREFVFGKVLESIRAIVRARASGRSATRSTPWTAGLLAMLGHARSFAPPSNHSALPCEPTIGEGSRPRERQPGS